MSSGSFVNSKYETDAGAIRPIRVQPETIAAAWNPAASGTAQGDLVRVSGGRRRIGMKARSVTLKQNIGSPVNGFQPVRSVTLPVMTPTAFQSLTVGESVTYDGGTYTVAGKSSQAGR